MCPVNHYGALSWGVLCTGTWTDRAFSPVCLPCTPFRLFPSGLPPAHHIVGTGDFHNKLTNPSQRCVQCPLSQASGGCWGAVGAPCRDAPTLLTFGAGVAAVPRQQRGPGTGRHGAVLLHVLAVHFPHGLPPVVPLLWEAKKTSGEPCQGVPSHALPAQPGFPHLFPSGAPGHLAQSPDACTAAKPGPPPHGPQAPDQLCVAPPAPASRNCSEGRREGA